MALSLVYIVKNEALLIKESLKSIQALASEIIVVDTGSTDDTVQIARNFGAQVHAFNWVDDFSAARNYAASLAKSDWIFFIDGDEVLEVEGKNKLTQLIADPNLYAVGCFQRNYTNDKSFPHWTSRANSRGEFSALARGFEGYVDNLMYKIYRNHSKIQWRGVLHETVIPSCDDLNLKYRESDIILHHLSELKGEAFKSEKKHYYLKLAIEKLKREPEHQNSWFEMGISLSDIGRFAEAEKAFREAVLRRPDWSEAKLFRARVLLYLERYAEAEVVLRDLLSDETHLRESLAHLSTALLYQGLFDQVENVVQEALALGSPHISIYVNGGTLAYERGEFEKARNHFFKALEINKDDPFLKEALAKVNTKLGLA